MHFFVKQLFIIKTKLKKFAHFSEEDDADNTLADPDEAENDYLSDDDGVDFNDARPHPSYILNDEEGNNIS